MEPARRATFPNALLVAQQDKQSPNYDTDVLLAILLHQKKAPNDAMAALANHHDFPGNKRTSPTIIEVASKLQESARQNGEAEVVVGLLSINDALLKNAKRKLCSF